MRLALLMVLALPLPLSAQQMIDLLDEPTRWSPSIDRGGTKVEVSTSAEARLSVTVRTDGDAQEDYPKVVRAFEPAGDWRDYARLRTRVRVTCDDPDVRERPFSLVIYDRNTLREDLPDRPMTQQVIGHSAPVGDWVEISDWLLDIHRAAVPTLAIYLYEQPASRPLECRWEFAELTLEGFGEEAAVLDMEPFTSEQLERPVERVAERVATGDGMSIGISPSGAISEIALDGATAANADGHLTGLLVRDVAAGSAPTPVGGRVSVDGAAVQQVGEVEPLALAVEATYEAKGDTIEVSGVLRDLRNEDRAVTLYLALPVGDADWRWWDGMSRSRTRADAEGSFGELADLEGGMGYGLHGTHSRYPLGAISAPGIGGLTLAVRMDEPVGHRIVYNARLGLLFIAMDFGLVPERTNEGRPLSEVPFRAVIYRHDPAWGFRSALQRYYGLFPEFFTKRAPSEGGWYVWGNMADTPGALEAGFGFHWGPSGDDAVRWDDEHGVLSVLYIEPELFQLTMGDLDRAPRPDEALERLTRLAAGDPGELERFKKLSYSSSYVPAPWVQQHSMDEAVQAVARAAVASMTYRQGGPEVNAGQYPWMGESKWGMMFACNLDPEIPDGKGWFARSVYIAPALKAADEAGVHYDGVALDSFGGYAQFLRANERREHFQYADTPLSFTATTHRPAIVAAFSSIEWLRELAADTHADGRILMANCSWYITPGWLTFAAPYLDVFGAEATRFVDPDFIRAIARTKPCTDLPYEPRPEWEVPWHLLHAIYPGHGNDLAAMARITPALHALAQAGWEPMTHARVTPEDLRIERYGVGDGLYLVVHNPRNEEVQAVVSTDLRALGIDSIRTAAGVLGEAVAVEGDRLLLTMGAQATVAIAANGD